MDQMYMEHLPCTYPKFFLKIMYHAKETSTYAKPTSFLKMV